MTELKAHPVLEKMVESANVWIKDIMYELNLEDASQAFHVLKTTLQALRDRLPAAAAVHLGAQLPTLLRGTYYDGWTFADKPLRLRKKEEFLKHMTQLHKQPLAVDNETAARAVFKLLQFHISQGEVDKVKKIIPEQLQELWPHKVS